MFFVYEEAFLQVRESRGMIVLSDGVVFVLGAYIFVTLEDEGGEERYCRCRYISWMGSFLLRLQIGSLSLSFLEDEVRLVVIGFSAGGLLAKCHLSKVMFYVAGIR